MVVYTLSLFRCTSGEQGARGFRRSTQAGGVLQRTVIKCKRRFERDRRVSIGKVEPHKRHRGGVGVLAVQPGVAISGGEAE